MLLLALTNCGRSRPLLILARRILQDYNRLRLVASSALLDGASLARRCLRSCGLLWVAAYHRSHGSLLVTLVRLDDRWRQRHLGLRHLLLSLLGFLVSLPLLAFSISLLLRLHLLLIFLLFLIFFELFVHEVLAYLAGLLIELLLEIDKVFHDLQVVLVLLLSLTIVAATDSIISLATKRHVLHLLVWVIV